MCRKITYDGRNWTYFLSHVNNLNFLFVANVVFQFYFLTYQRIIFGFFHNILLCCKSCKNGYSDNQHCLQKNCPIKEIYLLPAPCMQVCVLSVFVQLVSDCLLHAHVWMHIASAWMLTDGCKSFFWEYLELWNKRRKLLHTPQCFHYPHLACKCV